MKDAYKFIAGNSRATPIGVAAAALVALLFHTALGPAGPLVYLGILLLTLAAGAIEPVQ